MRVACAPRGCGAPLEQSAELGRHTLLRSANFVRSRETATSHNRESAPMKHFELLFAVGLFFGGPFVGGFAANLPAAETGELVGPLTLSDADGHELIVDRFAERRATAIFFL